MVTFPTNIIQVEKNIVNVYLICKKKIKNTVYVVLYSNHVFLIITEESSLLISPAKYDSTSGTKISIMFEKVGWGCGSGTGTFKLVSYM